MGFSRCAIYLSDASEWDGVRFLVQAELLSPNSKCCRVADNEAGIGQGEFGIAEEMGWAVIWMDSSVFLDGPSISPLLAQFSQDRVVFMWLTQSTSGGLWFEMWRDGIQLRKWVEFEIEVQENLGKELPEEPAGYFSETHTGWGNEWSLVELAGKVTGISDERLFDMPFNVYSAVDG